MAIAPTAIGRIRARSERRPRWRRGAESHIIFAMRPGLHSLLAICMLAVMAFAARPAAAQDGDALRFFQQNPSRSIFRSPQDLRRPSPPPGVGRIDREASAPRRRASPSPEADAFGPPVPVTAYIHVLGDSLAELLAQGLKEQFAETSREFGVVGRTRSSSGLVRDDYFDWPKALRELLSGADKVDMIVVMIGSNDRQALRDEAGSHDFGSDRWREIYIRRLDDLLAQARDKRIPALIVGMPVMQGPRLSADMLALNAIFRERAAKGGAAYVDIWESFASEQGQYASTGPDVNGEIVRLRLGDGVHFTRAGARKLGFFVGKDVVEQLKRERPATEIAALPTDLSEQIRRDEPGLAPQNLLAAVPLPELPALPAIGQRPLAGPILALTIPAQSPGAALLSGRIVQPPNEMGILVEQAMTYGRLPPAKPGRADDFAWPRAAAGDTAAN